jgi:Spy/CpxP family protein refolding chaperone
MIARSRFWILVAAAAAFVGTFVATATRPSRGTTEPAASLAEWLNLSKAEAAELAEHDPQFEADLARLRRELHDARTALLDAFERNDASDEQLRKLIGAVIDANNRLEWRVTEYLITVRHHLSPEQQKRLCGLCAEQVRACRRRGNCNATAAVRDDSAVNEWQGKTRPSDRQDRGHMP